MEQRMDYWETAPEIARGIYKLHQTVEAAGLEKSLLHLVRLRASQINGCAYCIDMHTREARQDGDTEQRLYLVSAWRESFLFTPRERAALAWTEALTRLDGHGPDDTLYEATLAEFPEAELVALTAAITVINTWNRMSIAFRTQHTAPAQAAA